MPEEHTDCNLGERVTKEFIYDFAGFRIGVDLDMSTMMVSSDITKPHATCFVVKHDDFFLQKLFSSYALFTPYSMDYIRKGLSLVAHIESDVILIHGAWTIAGEKNILLLGNSGAGKSTLSNELGDIVDDDTLLMREGIMYLPSRAGYKSFGRSPDKKLIETMSMPKPSRPDICLLLDKSHAGGYIEQTDIIPSNYYAPNYFSNKDTQLYIKYDSFKKPQWLNTYMVGTDGNLEKTIEAVRSFISK